MTDHPVATAASPAAAPPTTSPASTRGGDRIGIGSVARGGLANLIGAAVAGLSGFVVTWLVARSLGTVNAGAFFASTAAFVLIGTVAKLGTSTSLVYFPARLRTSGDIGALRRCLRTGLVPVAVAAVLIAAGMAIGAGGLARIAVRNGHAEYAHQLRVLAWFLPASALSDTLLAATRGFRALRATVVLDRLMRPAIQVVALAAMMAAGVDSPAAYVVAWAAPYVLSAALAGRSLRGCLLATECDRPAITPRPRHRPRPAPDADSRFSPRAFWRFTGPRAFASIIQLALQRVDVLLLAALAGLQAAGIYAVAGRFVVLGQFASQGITQAVQPRLAELLATGDRRGANALYQIATTWLVLCAWPLYLMIAVFAATYLRVFGNGFTTGGHVVVVLAGAMTIATGCGMVDIVLSMAGRTSWNLANVSLALAVQMAIDIPLIPHLGPLGAALGLGAAIITNNVVPLAQIAFALGIHPFGPALATATGLTVGCFGVLPVIVARVAGTGPGACAGAGIAATALYAIGLVRLRHRLRLDAFLHRSAPATR